MDWLGLLLISLFFYIAFVNVTTVNSNSIVHHSLLHPAGIEYQLSDVEKIETGFHKNEFSVLHQTDDFYYYVIRVIIQKLHLKIIRQ